MPEEIIIEEIIEVVPVVEILPEPMTITSNLDALQRAFSPEAFEVFKYAVEIMLKGMTGIFCFMLIFYLFIKLLGKVFKENEN
jgi:hypothetical protein